MRERDDHGAASVEYALLVTAIAAVIVLVVVALGMVVQNMFGESCQTISTAAGNTDVQCTD